MKEKKELKVKYVFEENKPQLEASLNFLAKNFRENFKEIKKNAKPTRFKTGL